MMFMHSLIMAVDLTWGLVSAYNYITRNDLRLSWLALAVLLYMYLLFVSVRLI